VKKLRYTGPAAAPVTVPAAHAATDADGIVELPDDVAASLLDQDVWEPAVKTKTTIKEGD